jgi:hypothetical protein
MSGVTRAAYAIAHQLDRPDNGLSEEELKALFNAAG